jgi:hypothetical protein
MDLRALGLKFTSFTKKLNKAGNLVEAGMLEDVREELEGSLQAFVNFSESAIETENKTAHSDDRKRLKEWFKDKAEKAHLGHKEVLERLV